MSEEQSNKVNTLLRHHSRSILRDCINEEQYYDVCFHVGSDPNKSQTFKGFKAFFAVQSAKFHQILFDDDSKNDIGLSMNSLDVDDSDAIQIRDLRPSTFSFLRKLFYQSFNIKIDTQNVIGIMSAAKTYNIPHLWDCCFQYILGIDFQAYSSSFFFLLLETQKYGNMEKELRQIIDSIQPIADISQFADLFNPMSRPNLDKLHPKTIIYLLFLSRKFEKIPQEYKWKMCLFSALRRDVNDDNDDPVNHCEMSQKMQYFLEHFDFSRMDWRFFIENVYNTHAISDDKLMISILCDYVTQHSHIFSKDRGKMKLFSTKFTKFVQLQESFVHDVRSHGDADFMSWTFRGQFMSNANIIKELLRFVEFNTRTIEDKQKEPSLYDKMDAFCENKWKTESFLNAEQSLKKYTLPLTRCAQIPMPQSQSVESLHPILCDSIDDKLASIMFSPTFGDVRFCVQADQSIHYGIRVLFAKHSKVFHAMFFTNFAESDKSNTVSLDKVDQDTFEWVQCFLYGHKRAVFTRNNVVRIYRFSDAYLMTDLRAFALQFICWVYVDECDKAQDLLSIIIQLYEYQGDAFCELFIAQIQKDAVSWTRRQCDLITQHPDFNTLSKGIIIPFLFSGLFQCYSQEMFWHIIVKWCRCQTPPEHNADLFLQNRLKPFLHFFVSMHELNCVKLDAEEVLILIMSVQLDQMNQIMQTRKWSLNHIQNILKHVLFVSLPSNIVGHMVANLVGHHNVSEELTWDACVQWSAAQPSSDPLNTKLKPFLNHFRFYTMPILYFETNVVSRDLLNEYQVMNIYQCFCDHHGLNNTINAKNVIKLCMGADKYSLRKLERNCLRRVTTIDVTTQCTDFLIIICTLFQYYDMKNNNVFWDLFIAQVKALGVTWNRTECDFVVKNPNFNTLSKDIIVPLLFRSGLFQCYSQETLWRIIVIWCQSQKRNEELRNFVNYFRFQHMDIAFFQKNVEELNVLTDSETMKINQQFVARLLNVIQKKKTKIKQQKGTIQQQKRTIQQRDNTIRLRDDRIRGLINIIDTKNRTIRYKDDEIAGLNNTIDGKDYTIGNRDATIRELRDTIRGKNNEIYRTKLEVLNVQLRQYD